MSHADVSHSTGSPHTTLPSREMDRVSKHPVTVLPTMTASDNSPPSGVCVSDELDLQKARRDLIASRLNMAADGLRVAAKKDEYGELDKWAREAIADVIVTLELIPDGNHSINHSAAGTKSVSGDGEGSN